MNQRGMALLSVVAAAVITAACGSTDAGISTKVKTNLTADDTVKTAQIDVGVQKKIVTLSGTVDTQAVKDQAVAVARQHPDDGRIRKAKQRVARVRFHAVDRFALDDDAAARRGPGEGRRHLVRFVHLRDDAVGNIVVFEPSARTLRA